MSERVSECVSESTKLMFWQSITLHSPTLAPTPTYTLDSSAHVARLSLVVCVCVQQRECVNDRVSEEREKRVNFFFLASTPAGLGASASSSESGSESE